MVNKIWVAITAHKPLQRLNPLINVVRAYEEFPYEVSIRIYVDYESQDDVELLNSVLSAFKKVETEVVVAPPAYEGWYLTWAHKTDLALAVLNRKADVYIYQENDMVLTVENFHYWMRWKAPLSRYNLEPGFIRYEDYERARVPFDNHYVYSLTKETENVWHNVGFTVPKILVISREFDLFVQVANPYYGAMILDQTDANQYIRSDSYDPHKSQIKVGIRNWPIADRSSMGVAFEDLPRGHQHRRCVPIKKVNDVYVPYEHCLIKHDDFKYAPELNRRLGKVLDCSEMFVL